MQQAEDSGAAPPLEIGSQAVWSLSSSKPGFGIAQLRDDSINTYWQSDGLQPHYVNIQFLMKTETISLYLDYKQDESYTPSKVAVRAGSTFNDLTQIAVVEFTEPEGWIDINVLDKHERPVKAFHFQVVILTNHQNGRDAHIRQVKVFEPKSPDKHEHPATLLPFTSTDYAQILR
ncbi:Anaphase-promoting complex subunit 10 [Geodia barretti]|uniref:Anaphase-promoting complex subunit 10 n=1 Tax=Geodia barretti TaxID=519541 RepID=A0AA35XGJ4_GEOBA|nr:Anaphase-promoting complex subunit 10 [Geodia barretti]